jgi:hypothetical protein
VKRILEQTEFKETALAKIDGHTIFSILMSKKCWKQLYLVQEKICNKDSNLTEMDIRILFQNLTKPIIRDFNCKVL